MSPFPTIVKLQKGVLFILPPPKTEQRKGILLSNKLAEIQSNRQRNSLGVNFSSALVPLRDACDATHDYTTLRVKV